ncbi:MAG: PAS domain S-box protein, partial [Rhodothermales bacterium]
MTLVDVVIFTVTIVSILFLFKYRRTLLQSGFRLGASFVVAGLLVIGLFYLADLLSMWVLPPIISRPAAMALMENLHLNVSWVVMPTGVLGIVMGFILMIRSFFAQARDLEEKSNAFRETSEQLQHEIAERKQKEIALGESEHNYRQLLELAQEGIWAIDAEANTTYVNPSMARMLGYTVDEMVGKHLFSFMDERGVDISKRNLERRKQGIEEQHEFELLHKDGSRIYTIMETAPIMDAEGRYLGALAGVVDITERKHAEAALRKSEDRYRAVIETQTEVITRFLPDTTLTFVNDAYCTYFGKKRDELIGQSFLTLVAPEGRDAVKAHFADLVANPRVVVYEHKVLRGDGTVAWQEWRDHPLLDEDGRVVEFQSVGRDITERKLAEEALRESEDRYRAVIETQTEVITRFLPDTTLTFVNDAYCTYFGKKRDELIGQSFLTLVAPEGRDAVKAHFADLVANPRVVVYEHKVLRGDGTVAWQEWRDHPLLDEDGRVVEFQSVGRDITERKLAEEALRESEDRFRRFSEASFEAIGFAEKGVLLDVNDQLASMLGYEREEMLGMNAIDFVAPESRDLVREQMISGNENRYEHFALRKDGTIFPVEAQGRAIPYNGRTARVTAIRDITQHKKQEEAMRAVAEGVSGATGEEFLNALVTFLAQTLEVDFVFIGALSGEIQDSIQTIAVCAHGEIIDNFEYALHNTPCDNVVGDRLCTYPDRVQELFPLDHLLVEMGIESYMGTPLFDASGKALGLMVVLHSQPLEEIEIAESMLQIFSIRAAAELQRRQAEQALRESEQKFATAFRATPDAVTIATLDEGRFIEVNDGFELLSGYTRDEAVGRTALDMNIWMSTEDRERMALLLRTEQRIRDAQFTFRTKDGDVRACLFSADIIELGGQPCILGLTKDITEDQLNKERLEESLSLLQSTFEATADGILVVDAQDKIVSYNEKFVSMWRVPEDILATGDDEKTLGYVLDQLENPDSFIEKVKALYADPETDSFDTLYFKDGRIFERYSQPQRLGKSVIGRVWSFRNVTERRRAEE